MERTSAREAITTEAVLMNENTKLWDRLGKTDPKHTKGFKRAGGFSGTAIKPMWAIRRMTEEFGACGEGWGMTKPEFQVVPVGDETLVFCTVGMWHGANMTEKDLVYGVGGDKCLTKRKSGDSFVDDEAFKKAYTDALTNAMKLIGVGADVHMGLFDDNKYVAQMNQEFAEPAPDMTVPRKKLESCKDLAALRDVWESLSADEKHHLADVKEARKNKLKEAA